MEINSNNFNEAMNCNLTIGDRDGTNTGFYVGDLPPITGTATPAVYTYPVCDYYWNWYCPNYHVTYEKSKVDTAFRVLKVLSDKKLIDMNKLTVGRFISLVNTIAETI